MGNDQRSANLTGRLVNDAEMRYSANAQAIVKFALACSGYRKGGEVTHFFDCVGFGKRAEALEKHAKKGSGVWIVGKLVQDRWQDKETRAKRSKVEIVMEDWGFTGGRDTENKGAEMEGLTDDMPF